MDTVTTPAWDGTEAIALAAGMPSKAPADSSTAGPSVSCGRIRRPQERPALVLNSDIHCSVPLSRVIEIADIVRLARDWPTPQLCDATLKRR